MCVRPRLFTPLVSLIGEHFVKTGRLSTHMGRTLAHLQRDREDADYAIGAVFTPVEADAAISEAERFLASVRALVDENG